MLILQCYLYYSPGVLADISCRMLSLMFDCYKALIFSDIIIDTVGLLYLFFNDAKRGDFNWLLCLDMFVRGNTVRGKRTCAVYIVFLLVSVLCQEGGQVIQGELVIKLEWCLEYCFSSSKGGGNVIFSFDDAKNSGTL